MRGRGKEIERERVARETGEGAEGRERGDGGRGRDAGYIVIFYTFSPQPSFH